GPVELRERLVHPGHTLEEWHLTGCPGLKEPLQGEKEWLIGLARGALLKKRIPLVVAAGRHELSGQRQHRLPGRRRPAHRPGEGFELDVRGEGAIGGRNQVGARPKPCERDERHEWPYGSCACHGGLLWYQ